VNKLFVVSVPEWLSILNKLPFFHAIRNTVVNSLIHAICTETDIDTLCAYLQYLQLNAEKTELHLTAVVSISFFWIEFEILFSVLPSFLLIAMASVDVGAPLQ
jgi:hypothetical protein